MCDLRVRVPGESMPIFRRMKGELFYVLLLCECILCVCVRVCESMSTIRRVKGELWFVSVYMYVSCVYVCE